MSYHHSSLPIPFLKHFSFLSSNPERLSVVLVLRSSLIIIPKRYIPLLDVLFLDLCAGASEVNSIEDGTSSVMRGHCRQIVFSNVPEHPINLH